MVAMAQFSLPGVMLGWALAGAGAAVFQVLYMTGIQRDVPDEVLGRVVALETLGSIAVVPLGYAVAGSAAAAFGTHTVLMAAFVFTLVVTPQPLLVSGTSTFSSPRSHSGSPMQTRYRTDGVDVHD